MRDANPPLGAGGDCFADRPLVAGIENRERDSQREKQNSAQPSSQTWLMAGFCAYVNKMFDLIKAGCPLDRTEGKKSGITGNGLEYDLQELKKNLTLLAQIDGSKNPPFAFQLANNWHALIQSFNLIDFLEKRECPKLYKIKKFIETLHSYPPQEEYTLGFYLTQFAGQHWLPFPFLDLLHHIHVEFRDHPTSSQLARWIGTINELLAELALAKK